jgi:hypothetical protein
MIHCQYIRACVCLCPYRLHKFNLVPIILEMEVTVKDPVSLFFVHCPFICWFSLAHSVSFTEVPNVVVRSQTEGSLPRKSQQPAKKNDIWEPVLRSLVLAPFLISSFLAENCRMRSLNTFELVKDRNDSQFWLIWGYPHLRKRPCATKTSDVFQLSLIVSTRPDSAAQKMGVKPLLSLISTLAPRFRKTSVAAILVQKTSLTPQNFGSKFPRDESERWCVGSKLLRVLNLFWGMKIPSINCQWHVSMYLATRLLGYAAA